MDILASGIGAHSHTAGRPWLLLVWELWWLWSYLGLGLCGGYHTYEIHGCSSATCKLEIMVQQRVAMLAVLLVAIGGYA